MNTVTISNFPSTLSQQPNGHYDKMGNEFRSRLLRTMPVEHSLPLGSGLKIVTDDGVDNVTEWTLWSETDNKTNVYVAQFTIF